MPKLTSRKLGGFKQKRGNFSKLQWTKLARKTEVAQLPNCPIWESKWTKIQQVNRAAGAPTEVGPLYWFKTCSSWLNVNIDNCLHDSVAAQCNTVYRNCQKFGTLTHKFCIFLAIYLGHFLHDFHSKTVIYTKATKKKTLFYGWTDLPGRVNRLGLFFF